MYIKLQFLLVYDLMFPSPIFFNANCYSNSILTESRNSCTDYTPLCFMDIERLKNPVLQKLFKNQDIFKAGWPNRTLSPSKIKTGGISSWRVYYYFECFEAFSMQRQHFFKILRSKEGFFQSTVDYPWGRPLRICKSRWIVEKVELFFKKSSTSIHDVKWALWYGYM